MEDTIYVAGIVGDSITDGPGLRLAIFMQGCDKDCAGCHNQSARPRKGGTPYTVPELMAELKKNPLLTGVTFSGGEPLLQAKALVPLAREVKDAGYDLAVFSGYTLEDILARGNKYEIELLSLADTLVDGPFILEQRDLSLLFRGSGNQRILDSRLSLQKKAPRQQADPAWTGK